MCFDVDSRPPIAEISGAAVSHRDLELVAGDGNRFAAFAALSEELDTTGIVIFPDVRGLYGFYEELALRLGERGYAAVAFDYFGRTAGVGKRDDDFEYMPHVQQTTAEGVQEDAAAAISWLRSPEGGSCRDVFALGFCFGGRNSWLAAAGGYGLAGAIGFYGRPGVARDGSAGPTQRASEIECPILGLQAGADQNITDEDNVAFDTALTAAGIEHEIVTYPGAPHSFFDRKQAEFAAENEDAWNRVLAFLERHAGARSREGRRPS